MYAWSASRCLMRTSSASTTSTGDSARASNARESSATPAQTGSTVLIDRRGGPRYGPPHPPALGRAPAQPWRASGLTQDVSSIVVGGPAVAPPPPPPPRPPPRRPRPPPAWPPPSPPRPAPDQPARAPPPVKPGPPTSARAVRLLAQPLDRELVVLPDVTDVARESDHRALARHALGSQRRARIGLERSGHAAERGAVETLEGAGVAEDEVVAQIGAHQPGRAEDRGVAGHQQARETQLARDAGGVDGTGAAAHHEQELPRVVAALHAHVPDARRHVGVDHLHHAGGGRLHGAAERRGQRGDGGARGGFVEGKAAAEEARG